MENYKTIIKQIKSLDMFTDASTIAFTITEKAPNLNNLSEEHINTLMWLNTILPFNDGDMRYSHLIAEATIVGFTSIKDTLSNISTTLKVEIEKIYAQIKINPNIILVSSSHIDCVYDYLQSIGLTAAQIKIVFFDAVLLDEKSLAARCAAVLKYWTTDDLAYLVKCGFFSDLPYYDVIEAINVAVDALGTTEALSFFHDCPEFFVEYRAKNYRKLPADVFLYEEALKSLENYKNQ